MDEADLRQASLDAIAALIANINPGAMVQRFVALVEVVDTSGERALWCLTPPDAKAWDSLGLIEYARLIELAAERSD